MVLLQLYCPFFFRKRVQDLLYGKVKVFFFMSPLSNPELSEESELLSDSGESNHVFEDDSDTESDAEEESEVLKFNSEPEQPVTEPGTKLPSNTPKLI